MREVQVLSVELFCGGEGDDGTVRITMDVPRESAAALKPVIESLVNDLIEDPAGACDRIADQQATALALKGF